MIQLILVFLLVAVIFGAWKFSNWFADQIILMFEKRHENYYWITLLLLVLIIITII